MHRFVNNVKETWGMPSPLAVSTIAVFYTASEKTGAGVDMQKYNNYCAVVVANFATRWQGALTCVIAESTDNTTYFNTYLATATIASNTTTNQTETVEIRAEEMSDGYRYARLEVTPATGTGNIFSAVNLRFNPRYGAVA